MNKEYEYSFKVDDILPFIKFCEENNYTKKDEYNQIRTLYKNDNKILARITKCEINGIEKIYFDLKDENESNDVLKVSRESGQIDVTNNIEFANALIDMLNFKFHKKLDRKRYVYQKNNVTFEIDNYKEPKMNVVAIEGEKNDVDNVYNNIKNILSNV